MQEGAAELLQFLGVGLDAHEHLLENELDLQLLVVGRIEVLQTVVGELAAVGGKIVVPLLQGLAQVGIGVNLLVGSLSQLLQIGLVGLGILDGHGLVRAPGGNDLGAEGLGGNHLVPAGVVGRVIGGTDGFHIEFADKGLAPELRRSELGVALFENLTGRGRAEELIDAEDAAQLQVRPVIQGVPHGIRNRFGPLPEGFPGVVFSTGDIVFINTVGTHRPPLVMVSVVSVHQPQLGDVPELDVFGNLLRNQVAVIVDDGHFFRVLVVKGAGGLRLEHEIWVDKAHGICY